MDKSWIRESRLSTAYEVGVTRFLDFAFANANLNGRIKCPCRRCNDILWHERDVVREHLTCIGFDQGYANKLWSYHGEREVHISRTELLDEDEPNEVNDMHGMLHEAFEISNPVDGDEDDPTEGPNAQTDKFYKLVEDAEKELYLRCKKYSTLNTLGTKTLAQLRYEEELVNPWAGESDCMTIFHKSHTRKKEGQTFVDAASEQAYMEMETWLSQRTDGSSTTTARNEVFTQVMGEDSHGRRRTYRLGARPSAYRAENERLQEELVRSRAETASMQQQMNLMLQKQEAYDQQLAEIQRAMAEIHRSSAYNFTMTDSDPT